MYHIAIPSYNRPDILINTTLRLLETFKTPRELITIFTASEEQTSLYKLYCKDYKVVTGIKGITQIRNFISEYYAIGTHIVSIDDDIQEILQLDKNVLVPLKDLDATINLGFDLCKFNNYNMWGVYPIRNAFFLKDAISTDPKFCIGHLFGYINQRRLVSLCFKEDYERSLIHSKKDGGVLRLNNICCKTKMYASGGIGLTKSQRLAKSKEECVILLSQYPNLVRANPKREGEILIRRLKNVVCL